MALFESNLTTVQTVFVTDRRPTSRRMSSVGQTATYRKAINGGAMSIARLGIAICFLFLSITVQAGTEITVLQTSDLHSHFTNQDSPHRLGGVARIATLVQGIRSQDPNTLFLDAGDWSEGTMFFTLNSGAATQNVMEALGYDAIVLGNHDWLIGPDELYQSFQDAKMKIPVLSANLNMKKLKPQTRLSDYIKPYIIKEVGGVRVGILGLSTFQFIYDSFFKPVKIEDANKIAKTYVKELREKENCDVVIVLSHLGVEQDKLLAAMVNGIDLIVGGHSHELFKKAERIGKTYITHVGKHGEYLGQIKLLVENGEVTLQDYDLLPVVESIPEDPHLAAMVRGYVSDLEHKHGPIFTDHIAETEVDLPLSNTGAESWFNNMSVDAMRESAKTDVAFDNPMYTSRDFYRGPIHTVDVFNALPHIYNRKTDKAWTIKTFKILGFHLRGLLSGFFRFGMYIPMSNVEIVLDKTEKIDQVKSFKVAGKKISLFKTYSVAGTDGIIAAMQFLKDRGVNIVTGKIKDTGIEGWRVALDKLKSLTPITREKASFENRVRTIQSDLSIRPESLLIRKVESDKIELNGFVQNEGLTVSSSSIVKVVYDATPENTLDDVWGEIIPRTFIPELAPGEKYNFVIHWSTKHLQSGHYELQMSLTETSDLNVKNNLIRTFIEMGQ